MSTIEADSSRKRRIQALLFALVCVAVFAKMCLPRDLTLWRLLVILCDTYLP